MQGQPSEDLFNNLKKATRKVELKTRMLVNALMPISSALESDDDEPTTGDVPLDRQAEALAGADAAAASSPAPLPTEQGPPAFEGPPPAELALGDVLQDQRRAALKTDTDPCGKSSRSPVPRKLMQSSADRKRSRSDTKRRRDSPQRRSASPRRRRRDRSESSSPPRRRGRSPGPPRRTRSRSRDRSSLALLRRDTSQQRRPLADSLIPHSAANGRAQPPSDRGTSSSGRRDRHSRSHGRQGRSPVREPASGATSSSAPRGRSRGRSERRSGYRTQSPAACPAPIRTGSGRVPAVPTSPVSPARGAPSAAQPAPCELQSAQQPGVSEAAPTQQPPSGDLMQGPPVPGEGVHFLEAGGLSYHPTVVQQGEAPAAASDAATDSAGNAVLAVPAEAAPPLPEVAPAIGVFPDAFVQALMAAADGAAVEAAAEPVDGVGGESGAIVEAAGQAEATVCVEAEADPGAMALMDVVAEPEALVDFPFNAKRGACRRGVHPDRLLVVMWIVPDT